jgi:hypothetical protein
VGNRTFGTARDEDRGHRVGSRWQNTSSGSGSGASSSHVSVSSASLALGCACAHSLFQGIGGMSQSSIELILGHVAQPASLLVAGAVPLCDTSNVDRSESALGNPEIHVPCSFGAEAR